MSSGGWISTNMPILLHLVLIISNLPYMFCQEFIRYGQFNGSMYYEWDTGITFGYMGLYAEIEFKPEELSGIILYHTNRNYDFFSVALYNGLVVYRFDCGAGQAIITSDSPVNLGEWNTLKFEKISSHGSLTLNGGNKKTGQLTDPAWIIVNTKNGEYLCVGGYRDNFVQEQAGMSTKFGQHFNVSLLDDNDFQSKLDNGEIGSCFADQCNVSGVIKYASTQQDPLCHWNKNNSLFRLESMISSDCPVSLYTTTQEWKFYELTSSEPDISSSNEVDMGEPMTETTAVLSYSDTPESGYLSSGVYGVTVDFNVSSSIDTQAVNVTGYFIITCNDVSSLDADCEASRSLLTSLGIDMDLSSSVHCFNFNSQSEGSMQNIFVDKDSLDALTTTEMTTTEMTTTEMTTTVETTTETTYTSTASTELTTTEQTTTGSTYTSTASTELTTTEASTTGSTYTSTASTDLTTTEESTTGSTYTSSASTELTTTEESTTGSAYTSTASTELTTTAESTTESLYTSTLSTELTTTEQTTTGSTYTSTISTELTTTEASTTGSTYTSTASTDLTTTEESTTGSTYTSSASTELTTTAESTTESLYTSTLSTELTTTEQTTTGSTYTSTISTELTTTEASTTGSTYTSTASTDLTTTEESTTGSTYTSSASTELTTTAESTTESLYTSTLSTELTTTEQTTTGSTYTSTISTELTTTEASTTGSTYTSTASTDLTTTEESTTGSTYTSSASTELTTTAESTTESLYTSTLSTELTTTEQTTTGSTYTSTISTELTTTEASTTGSTYTSTASTDLTTTEESTTGSTYTSSASTELTTTAESTTESLYTSTLSTEMTTTDGTTGTSYTASVSSELTTTVEQTTTATSFPTTASTEISSTILSSSIEVITATTESPKLEHAIELITCYSNCESKVNPSKMVKLRGTCRNCSLGDGDVQTRCQDCQESVVYYTWEYLVCNTDGCQSSLLSNGSGVTRFDVLPVTDPESYGKVNMTVLLEGGAVVSTLYNIEVNRAPAKGYCSVSPDSGHGLHTTYNISCDGFLDDDQPLVYSLYQAGGTGTLELLYQSSDQHMVSLYLMEGRTDMNYTYNLTVMCSDKFGLGTETDVQVKVLPPASPDGIMDMVKNLLGIYSELSRLNDLLAQGKIAEVLQVLQICTSYLNKHTAKTVNETEEHAKIREEIVRILTKVNITDLSMLATATTIINGVAYVPAELTRETQNNVTDLYGSMAQFLQSESDSLTLSETETSIGLLLNGLTSWMEFKTEEGTKLLQDPVTTAFNQSNVNQSEAKDEVKSSVESILSVVSLLTDAVQDIVLIDTEPVAFSSDTMDMVVAKVSKAELIPESLSVTSKKEGSPVLAGVILPSDSDFFDTISQNSQTSVGIQMVTMEKNPYMWDVSADDVTTPVLSLVLKDDNKETIQVNQLQSEGIGINLANRAVYGNESLYEVEVAFEYDGDSVNVTNTQQACLVLTLNTTQGRSDVLKLEPKGLDVPLKVLVNATDTMLYNYSHIIREGILATSEYNYTFVVSSNYSEEVRVSICPYVSEEYMNYYQNLSVQSEECGPESDCKDLYVVTMNISVQTYSAACLYWDTLTEAWSTDGCQVSSQTTTRSIQCWCSHLTAFSGSVFVLPNTVDPFTDAALFLTFFDNPVVVMTVIVIWIIYFLLLGWARMADRKDLTKGGVTVLRENEPDDQNLYLVCVVTGWRHNAGTTANVSISLTGDGGYSIRRCLSDSVNHKQCFSAGSEEWFTITTPTDLGHIHHITVWHDNIGISPEWFLSRIMIENLQTKQVWTFLYGDWIALDKGSLSVSVVLESITEENMADYKKQNFYLKSSRDLRDSHLWISIMCKPSYSSFTRVQRLTCALSLLLMTMLTSLMFHGIPLDDPADQVGSGQISFSLADIVIGIQSGLIIFPISIIVLQLFIRAGPRPRRSTDNYLLDFNAASKYYTLPTDERKHDPSATVEEQFDQHNLEPKSEAKKLPWWTIYIAWTLVLSSSVISSYFVMLYGLKYGYQKSVDWLISFFIAFVQSAFVTQPLKVFGVAILMTIILKRPILLEGGKAESEHAKENFITDIPRSHFIPDPLTKHKRNQIRERLKLEGLTFEKLRDIGLYIFYVCVVLFMVHGQRSIELSYRCTESLENIFINPSHKDDHLAFKKINSVNSFWEYVNMKVVPDLSEMGNHNDSSYTRTSCFYLVGLYRLRQLRVNQDTCDFIADSYKRFTTFKRCNGPYWLGDEDDKNYNYSWSLVSSNDTASVHNEWSYRSPWQLQTIPYRGFHATYGGGGYTVEFDNDAAATTERLSSLQKQGWTDDRTRAIFIEFTVYNPNVDLFSIVMLLFEFPNTGGVTPFYQIFTTKLSFYTNGLEIFAAVCEGLFLCFTLIFTYIEIQKVKERTIKIYFSDTWNVVEFIQICLSYSIAGIFFQRLVSVESVMKKYSQSKSFVSFYTAVSWDLILHYLMATLVVIVILKFFKILKFNKKMFFLSSTLAHGRKDFFSFGVMAFVLLSAFAHFATLVLGPFVAGLKSFGDSFMTFTNFMLGVSLYYDLSNASPTFGPILYLLFFFMSNCFILLVFISIINYAIKDSKETLEGMKNELEVVDYVLRKLFHQQQTKHDRK